MAASSSGDLPVFDSLNDDDSERKKISPAKQKAYAQAVDRALKTFENPNEWADLISALGKLAKVFQSNAKQVGYVPNDVTVAKRLSQCLHPALPMGVHLKALETYRQIFEMVGTKQLPRILYLFAVGLFPLMDHCGIKVKSELFSIFETYLLPLDTELRASLPGFLGAVLLGLEEGTEFYEKSLNLLDQVCKRVGAREFYACLWQAVIGSPPVRLPAMIYVNVKYDKCKSLDEQIFIVGEDVNHMVAALCATSDDNGSPLVQRYLLDFLVSAFPLDSTNIQKEDFVQLLRRCMFVILRRDMSLNRRLYTWLINRSGESTGVSGLSTPEDALDMSFFGERVLPLIVDALDEYLRLDTIHLAVTHNNTFTAWSEKKEADQVQFAEVRVCRLLLYLQDRADIGKAILDAVFANFLRKSADYHNSGAPNKATTSDETPTRADIPSLTLALKTSPSMISIEPEVDLQIHERRSDELTKTFNMLLNSLEPGFLWEFLGSWFEKTIESAETDQFSTKEIHDFSQVVSVCVEIVNMESDAKVRSQYLPELLRRILIGLSNEKLIKASKQQDLLSLYQVASKLLTITTTRMASPVSVVESVESSPSHNADSVASIEHGCSLIEECLSACFSALSTTFSCYVARRSSDVLPLVNASCSLLDAFLNVPIFTVDIDDDVAQQSRPTPQWLNTMLEVIDGAGWLKEMRAAQCDDVSARATLLDLLCAIYTRSVSMHEQSKELHKRQDKDTTITEATTLLLKPLLTEREIRLLEEKFVFSTCAEAVWLGVGAKWCNGEQQRLARLLVKLHSRKATEPSSEVENIVVSALTSHDEIVCTEAAKTFHRVWVLTRGDESFSMPICIKPFNRVVMILLGVLADESISRARTELKAAAGAWFADCAKHNDLPRIVQMLSTMLMNPATARISIQYLRQESRMTHDNCQALPSDVSAVTLITIDGKQRLYHVDGSQADGSWLSEVRNRLLLNSNDESSVSEAHRISPCNVPCGDVPNFDDDTDSLDTLSLNLEGIDPGVVETLQYLIDQVVEEEEMDVERKRLSHISMNGIEPTGAMFTLTPRDDESSELTTETETIQEEEPKPAPINETVQRVKKGHRRQDSLQESIFSMTERDLKAFDATEILRPSTESESGTTLSASLFDELHIHMLLYGESGRVVDLSRAETAFRILTALLSPRGAGTTANRLLLNCLVSSGTATSSGDELNSSSTYNGSLVDLMTRHVRAILGQHFWSTSSSDDDSANKHRHLTLLELLITVALHYLRSYFLNSPVSPVTEADLVIAWKCKISALDFLTELVGELSAMVNEQESRSFVVFIQAILSRAKLQKCLLHMLLTAVHHDPESINKAGQPLSMSISEFNEGRQSAASRRLSPLLAAYHRSLLALTAQSIRLESDIKNGFSSFHDNASGGSRRISINQQLYNSTSRASAREPHASLVELRAFLVILLSALKKQPHRHEMWLQFIVQILPWMERSLATVVCRVVEQLCKNVEAAMSEAYVAPVTSDVTTDKSFDMACDPDGYPANYLVMTLESLTTLVHFCVIDTTPSVGSSTIQTTTPVTVPTTSVVGHAMSVIPGTKGATELFSNLVKVFTFSESNTAGGISKIDSTRQHGNGWRQAQSDMLSSFPHSLATICNVWTLVRTHQSPSLPLGTTSQLRRLVLQLLSPIAQHHEHAFLSALALVWLTRSSSKPTALRKHDPDRANFDYSTAQVDIANLLLSLKVIPFEDLISAVNSTLKEASLKANKVGISIDKANFPTEEPLLELVHACVTTVSPQQLRICWPSLLNLFNDAPIASLSPRAVFLLFVILCDFVRSVGGAYIVEEKTMARNVNDVTQKLIEAVNVIVGWQLETTTWLKRTLVVKQDHATSNSSIRSVDQSPSVETASGVISTMSTSNISEQTSMRNSTLSLINKPSSVDSASTSGLSIGEKNDKKSSSNLRASIKDTNNNKRDPAHSTQALFLLSEKLTEIVDSISKSDDKERMLPTLHAVWANVVPYLKAKNARNARFFLASSQLLASMSSYSYMRPVWKKTTLELLLDSSFFKMDHQSLKQWLIVTDHLMTHDRTSFKDLLKSIAYTPNASFSIMTSKEQEYESRAQALKRLAFVVLGSQLDQYHAHMKDIQERLSDNLRVSQSPVIRSAVFLCIRVLLLRLRPHSLIDIWPTMVTELIHVLLQLEQQLSPSSTNEDLSSSRDDQWMQLFLAACKLLESLCTLPAGFLAQFQMCQWTFITSVSAGQAQKFVPFARRINDLLCKKYGELTPAELSNQTASLGAIKILTSFEELRPFFYALSTLNKTVAGNEQLLRDASILAGSLSHKNAVSRLENALYVDFSEHLQL